MPHTEDQQEKVWELAEKIGIVTLAGYPATRGDMNIIVVIASFVRSSARCHGTISVKS